jgi:hypothetical protein
MFGFFEYVGFQFDFAWGNGSWLAWARRDAQLVFAPRTMRLVQQHVATVLFRARNWWPA